MAGAIFVIYMFFFALVFDFTVAISEGLGANRPSPPCIFFVDCKVIGLQEMHVSSDLTLNSEGSAAMTDRNYTQVMGLIKFIPLYE